MRIGEITRLTGVSKDTVRFYERQGLLDEAPQPTPMHRPARWACRPTC